MAGATLQRPNMLRVAAAFEHMLIVEYSLRSCHTQLTHEQAAIILWREGEAITKHAYRYQVNFLRRPCGPDCDSELDR